MEEMMAKYRKKPVVIEAWQLVDIRKSIPPGVCIDDCGSAPWLDDCVLAHIHTLEGVMIVTPGDWVIRGVKGEFYPCKPDIFAATYEPVEDASAPAAGKE
jgi:hypothetical protein